MMKMSTASKAILLLALLACFEGVQVKAAIEIRPTGLIGQRLDKALQPRFRELGQVQVQSEEKEQTKVVCFGACIALAVLFGAGIAGSVASVGTTIAKNAQKNSQGTAITAETEKLETITGRFERENSRVTKDSVASISKVKFENKEFKAAQKSLEAVGKAVGTPEEVDVVKLALKDVATAAGVSALEHGAQEIVTQVATTAAGEVFGAVLGGVGLIFSGIKITQNTIEMNKLSKEHISNMDKAKKAQKLAYTSFCDGLSKELTGLQTAYDAIKDAKDDGKVLGDLKAIWTHILTQSKGVWQCFCSDAKYGKTCPKGSDKTWCRTQDTSGQNCCYHKFGDKSSGTCAPPVFPSA